MLGVRLLRFLLRLLMPRSWRDWIDKGNRESNTFFSIAAGLVGAIIVINISALDKYEYLVPLAFFFVLGVCFYIWVIRGGVKQ